MGKRVTQLDDSGRPHRVTRHQLKSEQRLIPWTPGPQTAWQRFVRKAVG